ncbi:YfiR/HmsC family protein [uncultured Sulfuricurvum sp.]|uniref:YfiR/HmsC family protein n=1 Tax=uncultured Sulfuricurvum sp. TaxID=430693 RepID=UPI002628319B|nr:YfiR/HmsC family protein [uncultured Sulfuricurvum sp.]
MRIIIGLILGVLLGLSEAKEINSDQVKVAYVYNFLKHTTWQNEVKFTEYNLLVVSKNDNLKNMFSMLSSRKLLNDKKIKVYFYDGTKLPANLQAIYTDSENGALYEKFFREYESQNVLLISDEYKDKQKVMINLIRNGDMIAFEINKPNIINRSLQISPDLILLGGTEIDVAKLYKSSQNELKEQKETVAELNRKIKEKNGELAEKIAAIEIQKKGLIEQQSKIDAQNRIIAQQLQSINDQQNTIASQQTEVDTILKNIEVQKEKLQNEEKKIAEKEDVFKYLLKSHDEKQAAITQAKEELEQLNTQIARQKKNLVEKEGVISTQKGVIAILLVLFGVIAVLIRYVVKQNALLNALSQTDHLTGLYNRRVLLDRMENEIQKFTRYGTPFSMLFIDVDHFKTINDSYGHDKGDRVLKLIASLMNQHTRDTDVCVRWGGEEFMILAANTDLDKSLKLAENFRELVEAFDFHLDANVTISIGVAAIEPGQNKDELIKNADNALYMAKESGRNCVCY